MTQFVQAMENFAARYGALPHFSDVEMFMTRASGIHGFTLELEVTEIGAIIAMVRRDRTIAAAFLALGDAPMEMSLILTQGEQRETVTLAYANMEWTVTSTAQSPAMAGLLRFAQGQPSDFSDWTLRHTRLDFDADRAQRQAA